MSFVCTVINIELKDIGLRLNNNTFGSKSGRADGEQQSVHCDRRTNVLQSGTTMLSQPNRTAVLSPIQIGFFIGGRGEFPTPSVTSRIFKQSQ